MNSRKILTVSVTFLVLTRFPCFLLSIMNGMNEKKEIIARQNLHKQNSFYISRCRYLEKVICRGIELQSDLPADVKSSGLSGRPPKRSSLSLKK